MLSKLDSLWSWRGRLVDDVITYHVIPLLAVGRSSGLATLSSVAPSRYEEQLALANTYRLREPDLLLNQYLISNVAVGSGAPLVSDTDH